MRVYVTGYGNKLIQALFEAINQAGKDASIHHVEELIHVFLQENKVQFKRNNPQNLTVLRSNVELMVAYKDNFLLASQIEIRFNEDEDDTDMFILQTNLSI